MASEKAVVPASLPGPGNHREHGGYCKEWGGWMVSVPGVRSFCLHGLHLPHLLWQQLRTALPQACPTLAPLSQQQSLGSDNYCGEEKHGPSQHFLPPICPSTSKNSKCDGLFIPDLPLPPSIDTVNISTY